MLNCPECGSKIEAWFHDGESYPWAVECSNPDCEYWDCSQNQLPDYIWKEAYYQRCDELSVIAER
jgi:hypothetical protein